MVARLKILGILFVLTPLVSGAHTHTDKNCPFKKLEISSGKVGLEKEVERALKPSFTSDLVITTAGRALNYMGRLDWDGTKKAELWRALRPKIQKHHPDFKSREIKTDLPIFVFVGERINGEIQVLIIEKNGGMYRGMTTHESDTPEFVHWISRYKDRMRERRPY